MQLCIDQHTKSYQSQDYKYIEMASYKCYYSYWIKDNNNNNTNNTSNKSNNISHLQCYFHNIFNAT